MSVIELPELAGTVGYAKLVPGTNYYPLEISARPKKLVPGTNFQPLDFKARNSRAKKMAPGPDFEVAR